MSDLGPLPTIAGTLTGFVNVDVPVAYFAQEQTLEAFFPVVTDAPSAGSVTVDLRTATGGGGSGLTATIASGNRSPAVAVTGSVAIAAGTTLYLRITAESGSAMNLSGTYSVSSAAGVSTALTSVARVKRYLNITAATWDTLLNEIVQGVSVAAQRYMARNIVQESITAEKQDGCGYHSIRLDASPISSVTATEDDAVLTASQIEVETDTGVVFRVDGSGHAIPWNKGTRNLSFDYTAGYATVPESIAFAATKQAAHEWRNAAEGGDRNGVISRNPEIGDGDSYFAGAWLPSVKAVLDAYRRI